MKLSKLGICSTHEETFKETKLNPLSKI